jgi:hypothetical protein
VKEEIGNVLYLFFKRKTLMGFPCVGVPSFRNLCKLIGMMLDAPINDILVWTTTPCTTLEKFAEAQGVLDEAAAEKAAAEKAAAEKAAAEKARELEAKALALGALHWVNGEWVVT